ncbi:ADP-ribosylglycohydrolase family protein [Rhodoplanes sp. TEM]|uniref:ADP-ribosylglycohydrolase family protein n=1 Tax=Rhodoplanes tepidamans TaxID=200616 RepID=A0ABT5J4Z5_RHOTP|nr:MULTISPECIES: ADP-ribosylglycohydrolase family protein [Rhodoplanes]MDC7784692.1 ADP-ribosylglycohydrolase family protein [Rhodoplanes tepidamans]MDC7982159.1 ADP-ribosylglycohydrolase family protein [Rhodoplanes sp. TEM]MDQ0356163.1 ADP-ribosyl-[dinitrogen reductase] hydrolase [Rhodoplanes tepidamans]
MRTSVTHPLLIGAVQPGAGLGRIGITFCPGKKDAESVTGEWFRDLAVDLDAIRDWGAAALVTLIEPREMEDLDVSRLGPETEDRHMSWFHLPIADVSVPDVRFEREWLRVGEALRGLLRRGFDIVVHGRGGLGRAGTIAARLMIELGVAPDEAIRAVRGARPGAIATVEQERFVRAQRHAAEAKPGIDEQAVQRRAIGALVGLAVGDAIGTTLEFEVRDTFPRITDMVGGGPFRLAPGQWTDDTAMALALADSLLERGRLDEADLMRRFEAWYRTGRYSCTGICFDIGNATREAIETWQRSGDPLAGSPSPEIAGNGSLMRLSPVAIRWWNEPATLETAARGQSQTTHASPATLDACAAFAAMLADAIAGAPPSVVFRPRGDGLVGPIAAVMNGSWRGETRHVIRSTGYVAHTLEAAIWSVARSHDFRSAVLTAANLGYDADTTAAVAGQLAGALYGVDGIPSDWREKLAWGDEIERRSAALHEHSIRAPSATVTRLDQASGRRGQ